MGRYDECEEIDLVWMYRITIEDKQIGNPKNAAVSTVNSSSQKKNLKIL